MSKQRDTVYAQRREVLLGPDADVEESTEGMIADFVDHQLATHLPIDQSHENWDIDGLRAAITDAVPSSKSSTSTACAARPPPKRRTPSSPPSPTPSTPARKNSAPP